ncbi:MFS transporter [Haloarchaeobius sp. DT45]|uniref:MFS transporter n=1 Tax=Haloarchaeobius sp. DT45 TaxID=3446116 RepID=UPI003F6BDC26
MRTLLSNRDFARLLAGRLVTNVGDSLYFVAAMWLVYDLTGNAAYSGIAGFLVLAPSALQAFAGPLVDRWNIRRVLVGTQLVQGVVIVALPVADHFGYLSVWLILAVMPLLSLLNQLVYPAQSAALPRIVEDDELVQANSLFSLAYQGTDTVANAAGGVLIALVGAITLFLVDSVTFLAAALLFTTVSIPAAGESETASGANTSGTADTTTGDTATATDGGTAADEDRASADGETEPNDTESGYLADLREGIEYVRGTVLVPMILGASLVNFAAGGTAIAAMPAFADTFGGSGAYGALMAAISAGSLLGAVVASLVDDRPFGALSIAAFLASGVLWLAAVGAGMRTGSLVFTAGLFTVAFVPVGVSNILLSSMVQSIVPEALVGRVSSVLGSASMVSVPFGALLGGTLTELFGPGPLLATGGVAILGLGCYWFLDERLRGLGAVGDVETLTSPASG